jgi:hypothetical protein
MIEPPGPLHDRQEKRQIKMTKRADLPEGRERHSLAVWPGVTCLQASHVNQWISLPAYGVSVKRAEPQLWQFGGGADPRRVPSFTCRKCSNTSSISVRPGFIFGTVRVEPRQGLTGWWASRTASISCFKLRKASRCSLLWEHARSRDSTRCFIVARRSGGVRIRMPSSMQPDDSRTVTR